MRFPVSQALVALVALAGLSAGCSSPCEGFNPYAAYERTDPTDEKTKDKVEPGKFQVICYRRGDEQLIEAALNEALRGAGGGSVAKLGDKETQDALLQFARAPKGPYAAQPVALGKYEVKFRAGNIDMAQNLKVVWKGDEKGAGIVTFEVGGEAPGPVTLIQETGAEEWTLVFKPEAGLYAPGPQIVPNGSGWGLRTRQFDIKMGEAGNADIKDILSEDLEVIPPPVAIYEVTGFSGDMSKFLCELLREVRHPDPQDENATAQFEMTNTYVWLDARANRGGVDKAIRASCEELGAAAKAENVSVEIEGLGTFAQTPDDTPEDAPHVLTSKFVPGERKVVLEFVLRKPEREPADEYVVFKYTIAGKEYRKRVKAKTAGGK